MMAAAGLLAASIVVFVPLAMAGWHMTRNRVLFFSAILFIILAATVHILPYIPSFSPFFSSVQSTLSQFFSSSPTTCLYNPQIYYFSDNSSQNFTWSWRKTACNFEPFTREAALEYLTSTWIVVAGDSQARFFLLSLLELLLENPEPIKSKLFKYHSDFEYDLHDKLRISFIWAPYTNNLTEFMYELQQNRTNIRPGPDLIIMGAGLWHMLHITNSTEYGQELAALRRSTRYFTDLFWLNLPVLVPKLFNSDNKRLRMTSEMQLAYDKEFIKSKLVFPEGPFRLLDLKRLSSSCGEQCTQDGMHYADAVYRSLVQIMLRTLVLTRS